VTMLEAELRGLHRDLRTIAKAPSPVSKMICYLPCCARSRTHRTGLIGSALQIRDLTIIVRNRKLKPEKGRRKDLRKIDSLIVDLVSTYRTKLKADCLETSTAFPRGGNRLRSKWRDATPSLPDIFRARI
jgi:hypothetical protein